ncbi:MAG TPA: hypothetical protein VGD42_15415, partial [Lysobacter sp.]
MSSTTPGQHDRHRPHAAPSAPGGRIEPRLGDWDARDEPRLGDWDARDFTARRGPPRRPPEAPRTGLRWGIAVVVVAALAAGLLFMRQPLAEWLWPETRAQQLQADAAQALQRGKLTSPDGRGARELYAAALALDPDRNEARQGLARVGQAALVQAKAAIDSRRYADAHRLLALARELSVPRARADALQQALRQHEAA